MSDLRLLFLVLGAVYLWECVCWIRRGSIAFLNLWGTKWRLTHPATLLGNQAGGIILAQPLPPLGVVFTTGQSPLSISPEGIFSYVAQCLNPGWRPAQPAIYFSFNDIRKIAAQGRSIKINGQLLVEAASSYTARRLAAQLTELLNLPEKKRAAALNVHLRESFDGKAIKRRLEEFEKRSDKLQWLANGLFFYLFALTPFCIMRFGLVASWIFLLAGLLVLTSTAAILFARAHRRLYPDATEERFTHWFMILLSPATSIRALDALSRPLLEAHHPVAVGQVLLTQDRFREFSERTLRELRHPALPLCPVNESGPCNVESYSRAALLTAMENFLEQHGEDPVKLCQPPVRTDPACQSYCPRCLSQFVDKAGTCADCGGLPLIAFPDSTTTEKNQATRSSSESLR